MDSSSQLNKTILVGDIHSDIYGRITRHYDNSVKIVIIPGLYDSIESNEYIWLYLGNPGVIDLYQIFIDTLFYELGEAYTVIGSMTIYKRFKYFPFDTFFKSQQCWPQPNKI